jgi:hypothetical protein
MNATVYQIETPEAASSRLVVCDAGELLAKELPPRAMWLAPWLESQSLTMIHAWRGIGKTHVALGIAYALASGGEFLGWRATGPMPTLYIDGEMPAVALRDRIARIVADSPTEAASGALRFITPDLQPNGIMPNLAEHDGQVAIDAAIGDARIIVVDNISCLVRGSKENEAEGWQPVAAWALRQRAAGRSVIFIHHSGKGGTQRGTSKREDLLDSVIALRRPADYKASEGARFEVHFEKARALYGENVSPFEAMLSTDEHGRQVWETRTVDGIADAAMIELAELGLSLADIGRELNVNKSTVMRRLQRAEIEGRYTPRKKTRGNVVPIRGQHDD